MAATTVGSDLRAAAAALAEQYDLHVFPCAPGGKKPACEHGCNDATRDAQRITGWWQHIPNANIGVATGPSNLVVIDLDGDDGLAAWAELLTQNGMHEMTVSSMTGRGGKHLWFRAPEGVTVRSSTRKLGPGLDVRAQGGYVVVPPSVTEGEYEWIMSPEDVDFALLPQPLVDLLQEQPRLSHDAPEDMDLPGGSRVDRWLAKALDRIRGGNTRNVTGYWLACQLRDDGMSLAEATPVMLSYAAAVNAMNGSSHPYETDEARRSLLSAFSRDKRAPAAPPDAPPPPDDDLAPPDWTDTEPPEFDVPPEYVEPETRPKPAPGVGAPEDPWAEGCFVIDAEVAQKLTSFPYTDEGNAQRFALLCASRCRHCREFGWMYWDRTRWLKFADVNAEASAKRVVRTLYAACGHIEDDKRKAFLKHAHATGASGRISGMIRLAEPEPTIMTAAPTYDRQTHVLNTLNGTVDLRDGTLRKHDRDDRITKVAPVRYFRTAQAPRFEQFLYEVFDGKQGLIEFMQRAVGYTLTGETCEQCLFLCHGTGQNGKGVLLETLCNILGDYAGNLPFTALESKDRSAGGFDLADLPGQRLAISSETNRGVSINEARVKALTGQDRITAARKYGHPFTFQPVAKFWLAVNDLPRVRDDSHGFWRRIRLVPFTVTFDGDRTDQRLKEKLMAEAEGILAWAVAGAETWYKVGLQPPAEVTRATDDYRQESDPLADFVETKCTLGEGFETLSSELYRAYTSWAEENNLRHQETFSHVAFGKRMRNRYATHRTVRGTNYEGIGLLYESDGMTALTS